MSTETLAATRASGPSPEPRWADRSVVQKVAEKFVDTAKGMI